PRGDRLCGRDHGPLRVRRDDAEPRRGDAAGGASLALAATVARAVDPDGDPARRAALRAVDRRRRAAARRGSGPGSRRRAVVRLVSARRRARIDAAARRARRGLSDRPDPRRARVGESAFARKRGRARPGGRGERGGAQARGAGMSTVPTEHALLLAVILFALGLIGVLVRRNLIFMLM